MFQIFILITLTFPSWAMLDGGPASGKSDSATLILNIENVRSPKGDVLVFLYNYKNQYPDNPFRHLKASKQDLQNKKMAFPIADLAFGKYGIVLMDDENSNEDLDRFLGVPKEGYSFSNNARPRFLRLPKFEDILIDLDDVQEEIGLKMRYAL